MEVHCASMGNQAGPRPLNDLDFIAESFSSVPESLADEFLFRHVHPDDPPGKTMVQFVDSETSLRVDVFRAYGAEMQRAVPFLFGNQTISLVCIEDLTARLGRLALGVASGGPTPLTYARDFLRLANCVGDAKVEPVWPEHRKPDHPKTYAEARSMLEELIGTRQDLLTTRNYSKDIAAICPRCKPCSRLRCADPKVILEILGYC